MRARSLTVVKLVAAGGWLILVALPGHTDTPGRYSLTSWTAQDSKTGLMWQRSVPAEPGSWLEALAYCESLTLPPQGGHADWRLPSIKELFSLVDETSSNPAIDLEAFPGTIQHFWSSTPYVQFPNVAWVVDFESGGTNAGTTDSSNWMRCVRDG